MVLVHTCTVLPCRLNTTPTIRYIRIVRLYCKRVEVSISSDSYRQSLMSDAFKSVKWEGSIEEPNEILLRFLAALA